MDWASLLLQTLDESPILLLLPDLHHKPCERRKHINPWQCHVLASFLSSLVPRIRAEIIDWKLCSSSYTHTNRSYNNNYASCSDTIPKEEEGDDDEEEISHIHKNVHIALRELLTSIRKAENYFVHHVNYDHDPEFLLLATSCNGEALCVHIHNIFWCFSGFVLVARLFHGYSDVKLSGLIEEQIHCWDDMVSQYIELGAENLDLQHMASVMRTQSGDNILNSSWPMKHLLSERLDLLILTQGKEKAEGKVILDLLKIDFKDLVGIKKKKFESENDNDGVDINNDYDDNHHDIINSPNVMTGGISDTSTPLTSPLVLSSTNHLSAPNHVITSNHLITPNHLNLNPNHSMIKKSARNASLRPRPLPRSRRPLSREAKMLLKHASRSLMQFSIKCEQEILENQR